MAIRAQLSVELDEHLGKEDSFLYSNLMHEQDHPLAQAAVKFKSDIAMLRHDWADYLSEWSADVIGGDWGFFRQQTLHLMDRLRERLAQENALLYPLMLKHSHIRLRAA